MALSNYVQSDFRGGEWGKHFQGRTDDKRYRTAMNVCRNSLALEEGAWVRRPGSRLMQPTYLGKEGRVIAAAMETAAAYQIEFTDGFLRFYNGALPVFTEEVNFATAFTTGSPIQMTISEPSEWVDGDEIVIVPDSTTVAADTLLPLRNRVMKIVTVPYTADAWSSSTSYFQNDIVSLAGTNYVSINGVSNLNHSPDVSPTFWEVIVGTPIKVFKLYDAVTGAAIDGSTITAGLGIIYVFKLLRLAAPYVSGDWAKVRAVVTDDETFLLNKGYAPYRLKLGPNEGSDPLFAHASLTKSSFQDGPYLDPIKNGLAQPTAVSGNITLTVKFADYDALETYAIGDYVLSSGITYRSLADVNVGHTPASSATFWVAVSNGVAATGEAVPVIGLQARDVGRHVRLWSTPVKWDTATGYSAGNQVLYNGIAYKAVKASTGVQPDTDFQSWAINPTGTRWCWGKITAVSGPSVCHVQIIGDPLLHTTVIYTWRLGVYSDAAGWPSCGCLHEDRLWLGGAVKNRFDASMNEVQDALSTFSPTLPDGSVADNCGISYTFKSKKANPILWMDPEQHGIACGTLGSEWMIQASNNAEALTPTNIQAKPVTEYGCADIEPRRTGIALVFVQKYKRRCMEFISDVFSGKYIAPNLNEAAKHITKGGVEEIAYQEELAPVLWARLGTGKFVGATYRRTSTYAQEAASFVGWHKHDLGTGRDVESLVVGPSSDGTLDAMTLVTNDATLTTASQVRTVELLTDIFEEDDAIYDAWFLDGAMVPSSMYETTVSAVLGVKFTGLFYLAGKTCTVFAGGLDVGDFLVAADGTVFVPYGNGVQPKVIDYTAPGAGAYMFTAAYIESVKALGLIPKNGGIFTGAGASAVTLDETGGVIPTTTSIQSFVSTTLFGTETLPVGYSSDGFLPNWGANMVTIMSGAVFGANGLRTFDLTTGVEMAHVSWDDLNTAAGTTGQTPLIDTGAIMAANAPSFDINAFTFSTGTNPDQLLFVVGASNYDPVWYVNQATLAFISASSGSASSSPTGDNAVNPAAIQTIGNWLVDAGIINHKVDVTDGASFFKEFTPLHQGTGMIAPISNETDIGFHVLEHQSSTYQIADYYGQHLTIVDAQDGEYLGHKFNITSKKQKGKKKLAINQTDLSTSGSAGSASLDLKFIGSITPSMICSAWTNFTKSGGICTDFIDFGTIAFFETNDVLADNYKATTGDAAWSSLTTYAKNDVIHFVDAQGDTVHYKSKQAANLNHSPTNNPADAWWGVFSAAPANWAIATTYAQYALATSVTNGRVYRSNVAANVGHDPFTDAVNWTLVEQGYALNGLVLASDGLVYVSQHADNVNNTPNLTGTSTNKTHWKLSLTVQNTFIVKIADLTPTILWKVPVTNMGTVNNTTAFSNVDSGIMLYLGTTRDSTTSYPVYVIDTQSGDFYVASIKGISGPATQCCDGSSYSIGVKLASYDSTAAGAPVALHSTVSFSAKATWVRLYIGSDATKSPIDGTLTTLPKPKPIIKRSRPQRGAFPCVVGTCFTSQGQMVRPATVEEVRSPTGPALGKTRRSHYLGILFNNTIGVKIGTVFTKMRQVFFKSDGGRQLVPTATFSGVHRDTLDDEYSFDSMAAWEVTRPYPVTIASAGAYLKTQDV